MTTKTPAFFPQEGGTIHYLGKLYLNQHQNIFSLKQYPEKLTEVEISPMSNKQANNNNKKRTQRNQHPNHILHYFSIGVLL